MDSALRTDAAAVQDSPDTSAIMEELERAEDLLAIMTAAARWVSQPDIYAWLMLPIAEGDSEVYVLSQQLLPRENVRGLIDEFLWAVGSTATAYGATVPSPEVINIHQAALDGDGTWELMSEPVFEDVGVATRGRLHAVLRACGMQQAGSVVNTAAQRVARAIGPYVDSCLLARKGSQTSCVDTPTGFLSHADFRERIQQEVSRVRHRPQEMSLLRVKLVPRSNLIAAEDLERANLTAGALLQSAVRGGDMVGKLEDGDIGVLMPRTGPRRALIAAMRLSDALADSPLVNGAVQHFVGVSGWAITGSDVEGLLLETELAASQARYASSGAVQLYG